MCSLLGEMKCNRRAQHVDVTTNSENQSTVLTFLT